MATSAQTSFRQISRQANVTRGPLPDHFVDRFWPDFDRGTRRAILRLYRSAPPEALARAGARLGELRCPALVIWGTRDPYIPAAFGRRYAEALGGEVTLEEVEAGHWLWLDRPELVDRAARFLTADGASAGG
jgi:pimeloyl-ACP methyl ester carboxylesterase